MINHHTALLVMDMQTGILSGFSESAALTKNVANAIKATRKEDIIIIFVRVGFRKGFLEVNANNKMFSTISDAGLETFMQLSPGFGMVESDIIVDKKR